jgi:hypothetical protein
MMQPRNRTDYHLFVPTSTLIEVIIKYRSNHEELKKCLTPIINREVTPINIGLMQLDNTSIIDIYRASDPVQISDIVDKLLDQKIKEEATLLRFLLLVILVGVYHAAGNTYSYTLKAVKKSNVFKVATRALIESASATILEELQIKLRDAYENDRQREFTTQEIRHIFLRYLYLWSRNFYMAKHCDSPDDFTKMGKEKLEIVDRDLDSDPFQQELSRKYPHAIFTIVQSKRYRTYVEEHQDELRRILGANDLITDEVLEYILLTAENILSRGFRIEKNDAFDLLSLYALHVKGMNLITLDKQFWQLLCQIHEPSRRIMNELGIKYV